MSLICSSRNVEPESKVEVRVIRNKNFWAFGVGVDFFQPEFGVKFFPYKFELTFTPFLQNFSLRNYFW